MINTKLETLLLNNVFSDKDRYEIRQIFNLCSIEKKQNILNNFDIIIQKVLKIKQDLKYSQTILLGRAISNIEKTILQAKTSGLSKATEQYLSDFRGTFNK